MPRPVVEIDGENHIAVHDVEPANDHIGKSVVVDIANLDAARLRKQFVYLATHLRLRCHPSRHQQERKQGVNLQVFHIR